MEHSAHPFWVIYSFGVTHINKNKNWKVKETPFECQLSKITRTNTDILNFAKLRNNADSVEKKAVHLHLNVPKKTNTRV